MVLLMDMKLEYIRVIRQMVIFKKYSKIMRVDVSLAYSK